MIKLVYLTPGTAPRSLSIEGMEEAPKPKITLYHYDRETASSRDCTDAAEAIEQIDPSRFNWIDIDGSADIESVKTLSAHFNFDELVQEDILTTHRPKMTQLPEGIFIVTTMPGSPEGEEQVVELHQISLYFSRNCVVTFRPESASDSFLEVRKRLFTPDSYIRQNGPDYLAYALLDTVVDNFFPVLEMIGDETESIEEALVEQPDREILKDLFYFKRILLEMRRGSWPQRELFSHLMHEDSGLISDNTKACLRDSYEHVTQIIDIVENYRDLTSGLMDVYHSSLGIRTNEIVRVLTLVSTFFIPLTFLVGVYGMNFSPDSPWNMPELHWRYGYLFFWFLVIVIVSGMFLFFKRKKWL